MKNTNRPVNRPTNGRSEGQGKSTRKVNDSIKPNEGTLRPGKPVPKPGESGTKNDK